VSSDVIVIADVHNEIVLARMFVTLNDRCEILDMGCRTSTEKKKRGFTYIARNIV
jgi:hypothetical protein